MKTGLFLSTIFIFLVGLFAASTGQADTFECINSTQLIEITQKGDECPLCDSCCTKCPPVKSCPTGESCQPDINPGENQQYPPVAAANWVESLGCTDLTDVALDDPRWGNREEGEVYAQEGNGCLSLYWPSGGDALFDISSAVKSPADWHDYRFSVGGEPRGGDYTVITGKQRIHFSDGGTGGVTVFTSEDDVILPNGDFLQYYQNPEYEVISEKHRLYPMGGVMPIFYWGYPTESTSAEFTLAQKRSDLRTLVSSGFTGLGMNYGQGPDKNQDYHSYAGSIGLRLYLNVGGSSNNHMTLCCSGDYDEGADYIAKRMGGYVADYLADDRFGQYVDWWYSRPEEVAQRMDYSRTCSNGSVCRAGIVAPFLKKTRLAIQENDPQNRPFISTDLESTTVGQYQALGKYREGYQVQTYKGHVFKAGKLTGDYPAAITQTDAVIAVSAARTQTTDPDVILQKPVVIPLIGTYLNFAYADRTVENWSDYMGYMVFTHMIAGAHGYGVYRWDFPSCCDIDSNIDPVCSKNSSSETGCYGGYNQNKNEVVKARKGVLAFNKMFTDYNFHNAFLWGDDKKSSKYAVGVSFTGPENANFYYKAESLTYADKQLGGCRYLSFTNSHWSDSVNVNLSGLPVGMKTQDMRSGAITTLTAGTLSFDLDNEGYKAIKIMPVSGECAG